MIPCFVILERLKIYLRSSAWRLSVSVALCWASEYSSVWRFSATSVLCWASACSSSTRLSSFTSELCRQSSSAPTCRSSSASRELASTSRTTRCRSKFTRSCGEDTNILRILQMCSHEHLSTSYPFQISLETCYAPIQSA